MALQGQKLSAIVESKSKPHEYAKFRMHLEDLDRINGLFFSLQTRLTKIEAEILQANQLGIKVCMLLKLIEDYRWISDGKRIPNELVYFI